MSDDTVAFFWWRDFNKISVKIFINILLFYFRYFSIYPHPHPTPIGMLDKVGPSLSANSKINSGLRVSIGPLGDMKEKVAFGVFYL